MTNDYPEYWPLVAVLIKALAGWRCENCGRPHDPPSGHTLTVHHLDGDKANCTYTNLVALCQRCHLRIQAVYLPGQLFCVEAPAWARVRGLDKPWDMQAREMIDFATGLLTPAQFERRYGQDHSGTPAQFERRYGKKVSPPAEDAEGPNREKLFHTQTYCSTQVLECNWNGDLAIPLVQQEITHKRKEEDRC